MAQTKGYKGVGMEGFIARSYDKNAQKYSSEIYRDWARRLARLAPEGSNVLEIAPGPGYLSITLAKLLRCKIVALEISETFVSIARRNAQRAGVEVDVRQGNVSAMPFGTGTFDLLYCTSSFKNFSEPIKALEEMHRVLRPNGKAWISDMRRDVSDDEIRDFVADSMGAKGIVGMFMRYTFRKTLRPRAYTGEQFREMADRTPFRNIEIRINTMDFEALLVK